MPICLASALPFHHGPVRADDPGEEASVRTSPIYYHTDRSQKRRPTSPPRTSAQMVVRTRESIFRRPPPFRGLGRSLCGPRVPLRCPRSRRTWDSFSRGPFRSHPTPQPLLTFSHLAQQTPRTRTPAPPHPRFPPPPAKSSSSTTPRRSSSSTLSRTRRRRCAHGSRRRWGSKTLRWPGRTSSCTSRRTV